MLRAALEFVEEVASNAIVKEVAAEERMEVAEGNGVEEGHDEYSCPSYPMCEHFHCLLGKEPMQEEDEFQHMVGAKQEDS